MIHRLFQLLLFLLPLHGAIVVFGFDGIRYWKEIVLVLLGCAWFVVEGKQLLNKKSVQFSSLEKVSLLFCVWLGVLVVLSDFTQTALLAARYMGLGFGVFFLVSRLFALKVLEQKDLLKISSAFVYGVLVSILFGMWAHFLGGYELLSSWYSSTISSWVPGQSIPLYHETAGIIRMQGASSGPVEFAHLLLLGFIVLPYLELSSRKKGILSIIFMIGIVLSLTRAVWIASALYGMLLLAQKYSWSLKQWGIGVLAGIVLFVGGVAIPEVREVVMRKASSMEHITKPIEVFYLGLKAPVTGSIGVAGPAARVHNLETINDDKAPVAENIFIDYFAQTGLIGIGIVLFFFYRLFRNSGSDMKRYIFVIVCVGTLASIFDMTPLSISYFVFLALMSKMRA